MQYVDRRLCRILLLTIDQVLFGAGDTLAQQVVEKKGIKNQEFGRTGRMALYGGCEY